MLRRQRHTNPGVTVAAPGFPKSTRSAAAKLYILIVTTAAKDSLRRRPGNFIGAPLEHIADHVIQAPGVRLEIAHRRGERIPVVERKCGCIDRFPSFPAQRHVRNIGRDQGPFWAAPLQFFGPPPSGSQVQLEKDFATLA